jgi:hypothetical protein
VIERPPGINLVVGQAAAKTVGTKKECVREEISWIGSGCIWICAHVGSWGWVGFRFHVLPFFLTLDGTNKGTVAPPIGPTVYQFWVNPFHNNPDQTIFGFDFNIESAVQLRSR